MAWKIDVLPIVSRWRISSLLIYWWEKCVLRSPMLASSSKRMISKDWIKVIKRYIKSLSYVCLSTNAFCDLSVTSRMLWKVWIPFTTQGPLFRSMRCKISATNCAWSWWDTEGFSHFIPNSVAYFLAQHCWIFYFDRFSITLDLTEVQLQMMGLQ